MRRIVRTAHSTHDDWSQLPEGRRLAIVEWLQDKGVPVGDTCCVILQEGGLLFEVVVLGEGGRLQPDETDPDGIKREWRVVDLSEPPPDVWFDLGDAS